MSGIRMMVLAAPLLAFSAGATADDDTKPSLDYISVEYVYAVNDVSFGRDAMILPDGATDGNWYYTDGVQVEASGIVLDRFLLRGNYYDTSGEYRGTSDLDFTSGLVGIGILAPTEADDPVQIDASIEWRSDEVEFEGADDIDLDGLGFSFGVAARVADQHDLYLRVGGYMGDFDEAVGLKLGYAFNLTENLGFIASYEYIDIGGEKPDDLDYELVKYGLGARWSF